MELKKPDAKRVHIRQFHSHSYKIRKRINAVRSQETGCILGGTRRGTRDTSGWLGMVRFLISVLIHRCVQLWQFDKLYPWDLCTYLNDCSGGWEGGSWGGKFSSFSYVQNTLESACILTSSLPRSPIIACLDWCSNQACIFLILLPPNTTPKGA